MSPLDSEVRCTSYGASMQAKRSNETRRPSKGSKKRRQTPSMGHSRLRKRQRTQEANAYDAADPWIDDEWSRQEEEVPAEDCDDIVEDSGSDVADSEDEAFIDDTATPEPPVHVLTPRKKAAVAAAKKAQERKAPALLQPRPRQPPPALEQDESEEGDDLLSPSPEDEEEYEETEEELEDAEEEEDDDFIDDDDDEDRDVEVEGDAGPDEPENGQDDDYDRNDDFIDDTPQPPSPGPVAKLIPRKRSAAPAAQPPAPSHVKPRTLQPRSRRLFVDPAAGFTFATELKALEASPSPGSAAASAQVTVVGQVYPTYLKTRVADVDRHREAFVKRLQADGHPATGSQKAFLVLHALHAKAEVAVASLDALRYPKGGAQLCRAVQGAKSA
mmetsp:Transcript_26969/g.42760  ORF Transcript_26969/g.42760 Transcript_26969/m.42760 type:complete len:386 (-) Transcript_26969:534-1691(-)